MVGLQEPCMSVHSNLRVLGALMLLAGLAATVCLAMLARDTTIMTAFLGLLLRAQFVGAAATALGGMWLEWFGRRARPVEGFPLLEML